MGNPYYFQEPIRRFFRKRRFKGFLDRFAKCRTIVDIGGDHNLWSLIGRKNGVIVVNVWAPSERDEIPYVLADGCQLPFRDHSVDLAFSNSAIAGTFWLTLVAVLMGNHILDAAQFSMAEI